MDKPPVYSLSAPSASAAAAASNASASASNANTSRYQVATVASLNYTPASAGTQLLALYALGGLTMAVMPPSEKHYPSVPKDPVWTEQPKVLPLTPPPITPKPAEGAALTLLQIKKSKRTEGSVSSPGTTNSVSSSTTPSY